VCQHPVSLSSGAVIFNSDLFHGTAPLRFRKGYQDRRVNVTLLFGERQNAAYRFRHAV